MSQLTIERRLDNLETQVSELVAALKPTRPGKYDWISTIGMFGDDPVMKEVCDEELQLREENRTRCRQEWEAQERRPS